MNGFPKDIDVYAHKACCLNNNNNNNNTVHFNTKYPNKNFPYFYVHTMYFD